MDELSPSLHSEQPRTRSEGPSGKLTASQSRPEAEAALASGTLALAVALTDSLTFEAALDQVAAITVQATFGASGAAIAVLEARGDPSTGASDSSVREVDAIQYRVGQGPCISAVAEDRPVVSGSLLADQRWPMFASRVRALDTNMSYSSMSLPLRLPGRVIGSLNIYAEAEHVFSDESVELGERFARVAEVALGNMHLLDQVRKRAAHLETALVSRAVIDQTIGIIRSRTGGTQEEAFESLRVISQRENKKLAEIASRILEETIGRARARHLLVKNNHQYREGSSQAAAAAINGKR